MKKTLLSALIFSGCLYASCGDDKGGPNSGTSNITLKLSGLADTFQSRSQKSFAGTNCSVTVDTTNVTGKCYTPVEVKGTFSMASLGSTFGGAGVRLLGGGTEVGLASVFKHGAFDLKTTPTITGEDNIQDGTGGPYNLASFTVHSFETAFVATAANKTFNVRYFFATSPPSLNPTFQNCGLGGGIAEADALGTLYAGVNAYQGDIMVCVQNASSTEACENDDFQWIDGSGNASATRPTTPKQLTGTNLLSDDTCTQGAEHPEINWGGATLDASLASTISISAAFGDGGKKTYTSGSTSGTALLIDFAMQTENLLFVPSTVVSGADLSTMTETEVLTNIDKILIKPIYVRNNKVNANSAESDGSISTTATVTITP